MADGKWIEDLKANTPLTEAARQTLQARLQVVRTYLPKALKEPPNDPEFVHQLRVATRRADAALRIFSPFLPEKVLGRTRKRLKRIRRAAGAARDLDVFLSALKERQPQRPEREQPGLDFLIGHTLAERTSAQEQLQAIGKRDGLDFEELLRDVILAVHPGAQCSRDATLLVLARPLLANLARTLEEKAGTDLKAYSHLHQVRIAGKRLRYAMEVFGGCFGPAFRETLYPEVEAMQEILGRANDSHMATERLTRIRTEAKAGWADVWKRIGPGLDALLQYHRQRLPVERRRFQRWWTHWRQGGFSLV